MLPITTPKRRNSQAVSEESRSSQVVVERDLQATLITHLRDEALQIGDVQLSGGQWAKYYVDAKRVLLAHPGFAVVSALISQEVKRRHASAVGGLSVGADAIACAALSAGAVSKAFFVRKERKEHGLQRWIEGPELHGDDRCLIVDDVVTTGGSTVDAINRLRADGLSIVGVVSVLDRLSGGRERIESVTDAPYTALTTIDHVYPDRPDR